MINTPENVRSVSFSPWFCCFVLFAFIVWLYRNGMWIEFVEIEPMLCSWEHSSCYLDYQESPHTYLCSPSHSQDLWNLNTVMCDSNQLYILFFPGRFSCKFILLDYIFMVSPPKMLQEVCGPIMAWRERVGSMKLKGRW